MDQETRIAHLEELMKAALAESMATDFVLRSLIAIHPDRKTLGDVIQGVLAQRDSQFRDAGFEQGFSAETSGLVLADIRKHVETWLAICRAD